MTVILLQFDSVRWIAVQLLFVRLCDNSLCNYMLHLRTRATKPNRSPDVPEYYGPQDFSIGAVNEIFNHRFVITGADAFVLSYIEKHANQFPADTIKSLKENIGQCQMQKEPIKGGALNLKQSHGDVDELVRQMRV